MCLHLFINHCFTSSQPLKVLSDCNAFSKAAEADGLEFVDISLGSALVLAQKDKEEVCTTTTLKLGLPQTM